jgi:hypothetical protein
VPFHYMNEFEFFDDLPAAETVIHTVHDS